MAPLPHFKLYPYRITHEFDMRGRLAYDIAQRAS
jgi:hypothetical protein